MSTDLARLTKCLELSASNHDGEALTAIRMANAIREKLQVTWTEIVEQPPKPDPKASGDLTAMFARIWEFNHPDEKWAEILESLETFYQSRGYLTAKQQRLLRKFDEKAQANMMQRGAA